MGFPRRSILVLASIVPLLGPLLGVDAASADPRAEEPLVGPHVVFAKGQSKLSLLAGYGEGFGAFSSVGEDAESARTAALAGGWGISISELEGQESWYRGSWELLLEGMLTFQADPQLGHGGGGTLNFRYNFLSNDRWVPFMTFGAGLAGTDFDFDNADDGFNFILQAGPGIHWFVSDRTALTGEVRWHHYSNAQTRDDNTGVNTALFLVGMTFFLD